MMNLLNFAKRFKHRAYVFLPALLAVSALFLSLESSESRAQPADGTQTLVFLRHAEKPDGGLGQLNCQGLNRAIDLATLLPEKFGKANYVFAANPTRNVEEGELDNSYSYIRPLMTISPSAIKLGLPVNINFPPTTPATWPMNCCTTSTTTRSSTPPGPTAICRS